MIQGELSEAVILGHLYSKLKILAFSKKLQIINDMEATTDHFRYVEFDDDDGDLVSKSGKNLLKVKR